MPSISIRLTRDSNNVNDDIITIKKNMENHMFDIHYTDPNEGCVIKHKMTNLYREKVMEYMYLLLKNMYLDEQKFKSIQFNLPAIPRILVSCAELSEIYYREHFEQLVGFALDTIGDVEDMKNNECLCKTPKLSSTEDDTYHRRWY